MKQVVFAVLLIAMASLTGCLNTDDSSVDEKTDDTTEDNSDTTEDNSDTTDDTKEDELIEPVGQTGDTTIPEDSSVFMDSGYYDMGTSECNDPAKGTDDWSDDEEEFTCDFTYYQNDFFKSNYRQDGSFYSMEYIDVDGISNSLDFYGWVNKTGQTVTIEPLVYPDRGYYQTTYQTDIDEDGSLDVVPKFTKPINQPVNSDVCFSYYECEITFYGVNNLQYNAMFSLGMQIGGEVFAADTDNDGVKDTIKEEHFYQIHTITFDLPFEPYGFEISKAYDQYGVKYNDDEGNPTSVYRIF